MTYASTLPGCMVLIADYDEVINSFSAYVGAAMFIKCTQSVPTYVKKALFGVVITAVNFRIGQLFVNNAIIQIITICQELL